MDDRQKRDDSTIDVAKGNDTSVGVSDPVVVSGDGMIGMSGTSDVAGTISGNGAVGRGEGREGASGAGDGYKQGFEQKAHGEAKKSLRSENGENTSAEMGSRYTVRTQSISDEEARRLLAEETAQTEARLGVAEKRGRKMLVVVIVVGVIVCIAGVAFTIAMQSVRR